ncbi:hypothetical protein FDG94_gp031 [Pseudomonas phage SM1]|uniref:Uncharacterized protein n=2 Tax=Samunavirus TaxID=2560221 RepID=A0A0U3E4K7_9CAUD|nr:hypothetical protein FDG94_gp031 [Pseudomonas phage SM1]ALT58024.1 hypothetical protein SM1_031 [Pseudomonas phage SM1]WDS62540.1 hypothetical protein UFRH6_113 [Pseudomonas phage UF_RH6]
MHIENPHKSLVLSFSPNGEVSGLHIDKFDLGFLGRKEIRRATEILFREKEQDWEIVVLDEFGTRVSGWALQKGFTSYERARDVEVAWLNLCRLNHVEWSSQAGGNYLHQAIKQVCG